MRTDPFKYSQVCLSKSVIVSSIIECPTSNLILIYPNLIFALRVAKKYFTMRVLISDTISLKKREYIIYIYFLKFFLQVFVHCFSF